MKRNVIWTVFLLLTTAFNLIAQTMGFYSGEKPTSDKVTAWINSK